ncbi:MAG: hypothetical protein QM664_12765 [Flavihumibacter sp.]
MKSLAGLILLLGFGITGFAQHPSTKNYDHYWSTFGVGMNFQSFDKLDGRVAAFPKYKDLRDQAGSLQLGWIKEKRRVISLFNVLASSSMSGDRHRRSSTARSIGVGADIGYNLVRNKRIMLYPMVGLGYDWVQARYYTDNSQVNFDDVLSNPSVSNAIEPVVFSNGFFNYRAGAGLQFLSPKGDGIIGIHGGYTGSFEARPWRSKAGQDLGNAPEDRLKRFYVTLVFGMRPMRMH